MLEYCWSHLRFRLHSSFTESMQIDDQGARRWIFREALAIFLRSRALSLATSTKECPASAAVFICPSRHYEACAYDCAFATALSLIIMSLWMVLTQLTISSVFRDSDHKPVFAIFGIDHAEYSTLNITTKEVLLTPYRRDRSTSTSSFLSLSLLFSFFFFSFTFHQSLCIFPPLSLFLFASSYCKYRLVITVTEYR